MASFDTFFQDSWAVALPVSFLVESVPYYLAMAGFFLRISPFSRNLWFFLVMTVFRNQHLNKKCVSLFVVCHGVWFLFYCRFEYLKCLTHMYYYNNSLKFRWKAAFNNKVLYLFYLLFKTDKRHGSMNVNNSCTVWLGGYLISPHIALSWVCTLKKWQEVLVTCYYRSVHYFWNWRWYLHFESQRATWSNYGTGNKNFNLISLCKLDKRSIITLNPFIYGF